MAHNFSANKSHGLHLITLMLTMLAVVAEFERSLMLERQKESVARTKGDGKYQDRVPIPRTQSEEVLRLLANGKTPT